MQSRIVKASQGLTFVRGSHDWGQLYAAEQFSENVPFECRGDEYQTLPDFEGDQQGYDFLSWDLDPGDCLVFDFRTIHCASDRRRSADRTTRRMTFRMGRQRNSRPVLGGWCDKPWNGFVNCWARSTLS